MIVRNGFVRIATCAVNLPFEFGEGTGVQGLDVDIGTEICKDIGYPCKWIKVTHDRLLEVLKNGEVEIVISAWGITPERKQEVAFSDPYFMSHTGIARRKDRPEVTDLASLAGKTVGVQSLTTASAFMNSQKTAANVSLVEFPTLDDALGALNRTEINAVVGDDYIMTYSIHMSFGNLMTTGVRLGEKPMGVAVRKNEAKLLTVVNQALERLKKSGELDNLRQKWFQNVMEQAREDRENLAREEALKKAPKSITINIIKAPDVSLNMDRLDGFQAELVGAGGRFVSEHIVTSGNRGPCRFAKPIPPGDYKLNMSIFQMSVDIKIPEKAVNSVIFDMNITSRGVNITER
ncbi:MAG: amino acid ABC transporter substrate-binding protein [Acidobacteria bacterium]|nr:amino acid ABC transporter substrate-binding protein [Acidobacteriota bacterium]